jgi:ribonuclease BN (tRNA processing enzyme)
MNAMQLHFSANDPSDIVQRLLYRRRRVLLFGRPGIGKSTLASRLAAVLFERGSSVWCLAADPGSPLFGVPGAVCLGCWEQQGWSLEKLEALCTLDAARFRLPLITAVRHLAAEVVEDTLLLDAPGVVRGIAGAELLIALAEAARIDLLLVLQRQDEPSHLPYELHCLGVEQVLILAAEQAARPGKMRRARQRTALWDRYLEDAVEHRIPLHGLRLLGTPPRLVADAWRGKQASFLRHGRTLALGEVLRADDASLTLSLPAGQKISDCLLIRDAGRDASGLLNTSKKFADRAVNYLPPSDLLPDAVMQHNAGERPVVHIASALAVLVNGVFGDPLLHLRLRYQRRSLLFDLGEGSRLPARIAHQVSDVFITHAHMDHICGFLWLLRSRIGQSEVCRLYGPPGLAANIAGLISGIHWDRIGERGPRFEVTELHDDRLHRYRLQVGRPGYVESEDAMVLDGVLMSDPAFRVRAVTLDHGTPVLAYAYEPARQFKVRKERLLERKLEPGPWLNELKQRLLADQREAVIALPAGRKETVKRLAADLILESQAERLVYATDFADIPDNRTRLLGLAQNAHSLFCEATFLMRDREQAVRTGHLTTRACGEIAARAGVRYLIPFHFSRRYEQMSRQIYQEIAEVCPQVVIPRRR